MLSQCYLSVISCYLDVNIAVISCYPSVPCLVSHVISCYPMLSCVILYFPNFVFARALFTMQRFSAHHFHVCKCIDYPWQRFSAFHYHNHLAVFRFALCIVIHATVFRLPWLCLHMRCCSGLTLSVLHEARVGKPLSCMFPHDSDTLGFDMHVLNPCS